MRLSKKKKESMKEYQSLTPPSAAQLKKIRTERKKLNRLKAIAYPVHNWINPKKNPEARRPRNGWLDVRVLGLMALDGKTAAAHLKHRDYVGLRKWPVKG